MECDESGALESSVAYNTVFDEMGAAARRASPSRRAGRVKQGRCPADRRQIMQLQRRQHWLPVSVLMVVLSPVLGLFLFVDDMTPQVNSSLPISPPPVPLLFCQTHSADHFVQGKGKSGRSTAKSQHRTWGAGLNFQQDPPILTPSHTGSISLRDIAIVGDFPVVQFNSFPFWILLQALISGPRKPGTELTRSSSTATLSAISPRRGPTTTSLTFEPRSGSTTPGWV